MVAYLPEFQSSQNQETASRKSKIYSEQSCEASHKTTKVKLELLKSMTKE